MKFSKLCAIFTVLFTFALVEHVVGQNYYSGDGGGGGGGGYCCPAPAPYPPPASPMLGSTDLLLPLLLFGLLLYLISQSNSSTSTGRRKRSDETAWEEAIRGIEAYLKTEGLSSCNEYHICLINRRAASLPAYKALIIKETSVVLSNLVSSFDHQNITEAALRGINGADCGLLYPECFQFYGRT